MTKKILCLIMTLSLVIGMLSAFVNDLQTNGGEAIYIDYPASYMERSTRRDVPMTEISFPPVSLMTSYYDYFPGSYSSFPMVIQPSPAGIWDGGGAYMIFHGTVASGGVRRLYYAYLENGSVTSGPSLINLAGTASEGFPGVDMDMTSGNPIVSWHGANPENDPLWVIYYSFDQYSLIGVPGLWNNPNIAIDNPELNEEYIWPTIKVGASPNPGMQRVYVFGANANPVGPSTQGMNAYIAFADYSDISELSVYDPDNWTHYEIPYMRDWALEEIRPYSDFAISDDGKVVVAGNLFDWGSYSDGDWPGGFSENDALFVLANTNYGEGSTEADWDLYLQNPNMQVENPDNYFEDENGVPYDYLHIVPFAPRYTVDVNDLGEVVFVATYRLASGQANMLYYNQGYTKYVSFSFDSEEFTVTDLYPRSENPDAQPYVPWDPDGDGTWEYDDEGFLMMTYSWPVHWWNDDDFQPENYSRVVQNGPNVVAVFQESMKARFFNEYADDTYASWTDKPETYIMISGDYGRTWADPVIMNANPSDANYVPEWQGQVPVYFYPAQQLELIDNNMVRLHLMYLNDYDYGSFIQGNGANTGGGISYMAIDFLTLDTDDYTIVSPENRLYANYPNPFNPTTNIRFNITQRERANLSIYNVKGQLVKTLVEDVFTPCDHLVTWNGTDNNNIPVGSGVYFYKLTTESHSEAKKMLMLK